MQQHSSLRPLIEVPDKAAGPTMSPDDLELFLMIQERRARVLNDLESEDPRPAHNARTG